MPDLVDPEPEAFDSREAEEVLERATELQLHAEADDRLSTDTLTDSAEEAGIDREYVHEAIREQRQAKQESVAKRALNRNLGIAAGVVVLLMGFGSSATLNRLHGQAVAAQAQVQNVVERRDALTAGLGGETAAASDETLRIRSDELVGAENRIAVERQRYNQAATAYNSAARSFPRSLFRPLIGLPAELPTQ